MTPQTGALGVSVSGTTGRSATEAVGASANDNRPPPDWRPYYFVIPEPATESGQQDVSEEERWASLAAAARAEWADENPF